MCFVRKTLRGTKGRTMPRACRSVNAVKSPFATDVGAVTVFPVDPNPETSSPKADGAMQRPAQGAGRKDWRSALGMFSGDALMKEIDAEGRRIREAEAKAQDSAAA